MERSPNIPQQEEKEEQMKVSESPKKAIFYIHHPVHFLQQLLRYMFKCLGFHEISVTNNDDQSKGLNPLPGGADYSDGYNNPIEQDGVVPSSASQQASDPPPSTTTDKVCA